MSNFLNIQDSQRQLEEIGKISATVQELKDQVAMYQDEAAAVERGIMEEDKEYERERERIKELTLTLEKEIEEKFGNENMLTLELQMCNEHIAKLENLMK